MKIISTIILLAMSLFAMSQNGIVKGRVLDATTNEALPFVNVVIVGTTIGATTDLDGNFQIFGLQPGFVRLAASFIGYNNGISPEVEVSNAKVATIQFTLESVDDPFDFRGKFYSNEGT